MKKHYAIRFLFWLLLTTNIFAQVVEMPDPNLREAVTTTLELPAGEPITQQNIIRLTHLTAWNADIEDLTGLEHATELQHLSLRYNQIQDLAPISNLITLKDLMLTKV